MLADWSIPDCSPATSGGQTLLALPPPCSQLGTLSVPQLPDSYRAGSSQLSWIAMDYRWALGE